MNRPSTNREIPEEVFRRDFGGDRLEADMAEQQRRRTRILTLWGLLILLVGPVLLYFIVLGLVKMRYCAWGALC